MSSPARRSIEHHIPGWREKIPREDTRGERRLRRILESLFVPFHSQDEGDFTVGSIVYEVDGPHHEKQTQLEHDAWKEQQLRSRGFRVWRWREDEVLGYADMVAMVIQSMWTMEKELTKR